MTDMNFKREDAVCHEFGENAIREWMCNRIAFINEIMPKKNLKLVLKYVPISR